VKRPITLAAVAAAAATMLLLSGCSASPTSAAGAPTKAAAAYSSLAATSGCAALRKSNPTLVGKTLKNAINPHTPGYEAIDPNDPSMYQGFDIDLGEAIGACLGFSVSYVPVSFAELIPTLSSGQADWVISDLYATTERAANVDFVTYSKVFDGILVAKNNPKKLTGINTSLCGTTVALNQGFVEVPLVQAVGPDCKAKGLAAPQVSLFGNNADCVQAILAGRADSYINDVNTVNAFVKEHPAELSKATAVTLPYKIGIGVPQNNLPFRAAIAAALTEVQKSGLQATLTKKWALDQNALDAPTILTTKS
jgi:polar amino acid transport system substrate-binding protein